VRAVKAKVDSAARFALLACISALACLTSAQQIVSEPQIPPNFRLDLETAARLRPQLMAQSMRAASAYPTGSLVFDRLVNWLTPAARDEFNWQLRLVDDAQFNAYASPDGTVYVESGLAALADKSSGLWAAILSHEVAHVLRRDWARRYLFQKSLESGGNAAIVLGDPGLPSALWSDSQKTSADLGRFCRHLEIEADRDGLMLMARAGYHPDFVPALHHLLHAQQPGAKTASLYATHPCWEERDRELSQAYATASIEFGHRWTEWYATPGGNPPVLVFAEAPTIRKSQPHAWEIDIPMRCQNLAGAVEVVLRLNSESNDDHRPVAPRGAPSDGNEFRQLTGCTSPRTTVTFLLSVGDLPRGPGQQANGIYVLDAWGTVLARTDLPKIH
jgi:hypothetical protein